LQREIKNKTVTYGIAALLLAVILTATVYNFGIQPTMTPEPTASEDSNARPDFEAPPQTEEPPTTEAPPPTEVPTKEPPSYDSTLEPETPEQPIPPEPEPEVPQLGTFTSYEELESFLTEGMEKAIQSENLARFNVAVDGKMSTAQDSLPPAETWTRPEYSVGVTGGSEYSTTNVQVAGVDEADIVKSDGEYLYVISGKTIYIVKAYPPDQAEVLSKIELDETYGAQIYVNENKLIVLESLTPHIMYGFAEVTMGELWINPLVYNEEVFLRVYDVTDRAAPVLSRTVNLNGTLSGTRMIGDYVYAVVRQVATQTGSNGTDVEVVLPTISGTHTKEVQPTEIRYVNTPDVFYYMTTVVAVDVINDSQEPTYETFLTGQTTTMYVSLNNMYLVAPNTNQWFLAEDVEEPREDTMIFRISLDEEKVVAMASGEVSGYVLNQFSMDEHDGYFRIATTTNDWWNDGTSKNNLFILNMRLNTVGKLEDLAPGEKIHSVRFMGDRGYIVTFRKIDPLFVIDLTEPTEPEVLGQLKVTGYSDYLHPYDETHLIGIGKETEASEEGDFAWYQGVKISLFDVSDVSNPVEVTKYEIGDRGTDSPVLSDHRALLFDKDRDLLVIPVLVAEINPSQYPGEIPDWAYGEYVWQGAYVFDISLDGLEFRGGITHLEGQDLIKSGYYYSDYSVERALYIDDILYSVSNKLVKMNDLESLDLLNEIELF
jgi:inhibitor of cysteine peptidase